jgi:plastocyanin
MRSASRSLSVALAALAAAATIAACGSDSNNDSSSTTQAPASTATTEASTTATTTTGAASGGSETVKLSADPGGALKFDKTSLTAKAGKVTLDMANPSSSGVPHAIAIEGNGVDKDGETAQPGGSSSVTVELKPGKYSYYCPVPGHEAAGMKGTLTVG